MPEAVRLVVWDLDETFWKGTLTEGGITEYVQAHHDTVVELAKRGIISSICSKNDETAILPILQEKGILDYFVFPSVSWGSKGPRLAALIETIQLRPGTVMFIDDNPGNRAEAAALVPGLQVEDETFIARMLDDARFMGKEDSALTRLAQYKLLETRKADEVRSAGDNAEFLRGCDVRVYIEYDVLEHLDRAVELINRTNQLNFTKNRLPGDLELAKAQLQAEIRDPFRQSGLVRVVDKYGDYGLVGFFMVENGVLDAAGGRLTQSLIHYCFSCRTLGMQVERWLYAKLGRPDIRIGGEVLTNLHAQADIDWIRLVDRADAGEASTIIPIAPEIRIHGGCEANSVGHFLGAHTKSVVVTGNFHAGTNFFRVNGSSLLLSSCAPGGPALQQEADTLGAPYNLLINRYFTDPPHGTLFIFGGQLDVPHSPRFKHKRHGWELFVEPHGLPGAGWASIPDDELARVVDALPFSNTAKRQALDTARHLRRDYDRVSFDMGRDLPAMMAKIFDKIPIGSKIILVLDHVRERLDEDTLADKPWTIPYADLLRSIASRCPFAAVVSFEDCVRDDGEIRIGGNHYDRMVYHRMAQAIVSAAENTPAKSAQVHKVRAAHRRILPARESVRLLIWDLDGAFWGGTFSDVSHSYYEEHHKIVLELTNRGIVNSICSDNDHHPVERFLRDRNIWHYFVFPSINKQPKGARVAQIIKQAQLPAESVLFIDDNFMTRMEVSQAVPGIHVESEQFIKEILHDSRFIGIDDHELTQLNKYKSLENREYSVPLDESVSG